MAKKRQDARYEIKVKVSAPGEPRKYKSVYGTTLAEARGKAKALEAEIAAGVSTDPVTAADLIDGWLAVKSAELKDTSMVQYREFMATAKRLIGHMQIRSVTVDVARKTIAGLAETGPSTANMVRNRLLAVWADAVNRGAAASNPWSQVPVYRYDKTERRALTQEEYDILSSVELTPQDRAWLDILLYTGVRRGESIGIQTDDVDFEQHRLHIRRGVVHGKITTTKSRSGVRYIPMPPRLEKTLRSYITDYVGDGLLFTTGRGAPWTGSTVRNHWRAILKQAFGDDAPDDLTPHVLRHNYTSMLVRNHVPPTTAQRILGHASFSVTMDIYTHLGYQDMDVDQIRRIWE